MLWLPSLDERALRERLRRRMHLVRLRTSAKGRIFGLQTQWGVRVSLQRLRRADGLTLLERAGVPAVWRRSVSECLAVIDFLDARLEPLERELKPFAHADPRQRSMERSAGRPVARLDLRIPLAHPRIEEQHALVEPQDVPETGLHSRLTS